MFHPTLIEQGYAGGRQVAQDFTKAVAQELLQQGLTGFERLSFWVTLYLNKRAIVNALREEGIASPEQFESFLLGFGQASPRFLIVDAGPGRDSTEVKVKGTCNPPHACHALRSNPLPPQNILRRTSAFRRPCGYSSEVSTTLLVCPRRHIELPTGVDDTYLAMYDWLEKEDLVGKLVLMQPPNETSPAVRRMSARTLRIDGLFMAEKVSPWVARRPGPLFGIADGTSSVVTNGGLISPQSESQSSMSTPPPRNLSSEGLRMIDPTKVSCSTHGRGGNVPNAAFDSRSTSVSSPPQK